MKKDDNDPIVGLAHKLETLIQKTVSIESLDSKLTQLVEKLDGIAETLEKTHKLVNSRMTALTEALEKAAALASQLAGEQGEERGAEQERTRAAQERAPGDGNGR